MTRGVPMAGQEEIGTRDRLLDAAERLVADLGPEAVSLRQVNLAAGANVASTHYHFGNKPALIKAALARRAEETDRNRRELLEKLTSESTLPDVVRAVVAPMVEHAFVPDRGTYINFLIMLDRAGGEWRDAILEEHEPNGSQLRAHYSRLLPDLDRATVIARGRVARGMMLDVLSDLPGYFGYEPTRDIATEVISRLTVSILIGPPPRPTRTSAA